MVYWLLTRCLVVKEPATPDHVHISVTHTSLWAVWVLQTRQGSVALASAFASAAAPVRCGVSHVVWTSVRSLQSTRLCEHDIVSARAEQWQIGFVPPATSEAGDRVALRSSAHPRHSPGSDDAGGAGFPLPALRRRRNCNTPTRLVESIHRSGARTRQSWSDTGEWTSPSTAFNGTNGGRDGRSARTDHVPRHQLDRRPSTGNDAAGQRGVSGDAIGYARESFVVGAHEYE